jgi:hypothetical protein
MGHSCALRQDRALSDFEMNVSLLIWIVFAVVALFWTIAAWVAAAALGWASELLGSGGADGLGAAVGGWPIPAWITRWVDIQSLHAALDGLAMTLDSLQQAWPWLGGLIGWLVPAVWLGWGLGLLLLLVPAIGVHLLVRRSRPATPPAVA